MPVIMTPARHSLYLKETQLIRKAARPNPWSGTDLSLPSQGRFKPLVRTLKKKDEGCWGKRQRSCLEKGFWIYHFTSCVSCPRFRFLCSSPVYPEYLYVTHLSSLLSGLIFAFLRYSVLFISHLNMLFTYFFSFLSVGLKKNLDEHMSACFQPWLSPSL